MTVSELREFIKDIPGEYEVRLGSMYDEVVQAEVKKINYNHKVIDCLILSEDEDY